MKEVDNIMEIVLISVWMVILGSVLAFSFLLLFFFFFLIENGFFKWDVVCQWVSLHYAQDPLLL